MSGPSTPPSRSMRRLQLVDADFVQEDDDKDWRNDLSASPQALRSRVSLETFGEGTNGSPTQVNVPRPSLRSSNSTPSSPSGSTPRRLQVGPQIYPHSGQTASCSRDCEQYDIGKVNNEHEGTDEQEGAQTPTLADATLRSAPGVVGIGEGWAGGPQRQQRSSWWRRRQATDEENDPLSLWSSENGKEKSGSMSPLRSLWNRSVQKFGGSMPHLPIDGSPKKRSSASDGERASRTQVSDKVPGSPTLVYGSKTVFSLASQSTPYLAAPLTTTRRHHSPPASILSHSTSGASEPHLPLNDLRPAPTESRRASGPRPPRRPHSLSGPSASASTRSTKPEAIYETPESTIIVPMVTQETDEDEVDGTNATSVNAPPAAPLQRTGTFGAAGPEADHTHNSEEDPFVQIKQDIRDRYRQSTVGDETLEKSHTEHHPKMESTTRRSSILDRIRTAFSPPRSASKRPSTPSPLRLFSRAPSPSPSRSMTPLSSTTKPPMFTRTASDPARLASKQAAKEALEAPASVPRTRSSLSVRHKRRKSWIGSGDAWAKRLSLLPEQEEEEKEKATLDESTVKSSRRNSLIFRVLPTRASSSVSINLQSAEMANLPLVHPTNLARLSTTDLDLHLDLPETGLGLDDILVDHKRQSIIDTYDLHDSSHIFAFPIPPSRSGTPSSSATATGTDHIRSTHSRVLSVPTTISSKSSRSSTFPETPKMMSYERQYPSNPLLRHQRSEASVGEGDNMSFYSARAIQDTSVEGEALVSDASKAGSRLSGLSVESELGTSSLTSKGVKANDRCCN